MDTEKSNVHIIAFTGLQVLLNAMPYRTFVTVLPLYISSIHQYISCIYLPIFISPHRPGSWYVTSVVILVLRKQIKITMMGIVVLKTYIYQTLKQYLT